MSTRTHTRRFSAVAGWALAAAAVAGLTLTACGDKDEKKKPVAAAKAKPAAKKAEKAPEISGVELLDAAKKFFGPLPARAESPNNPTSEAKVALGRTLYYDTRLSKNHDISCNSCHMLDKYGVDNEPTSPGHRAQRGERNSPTVYNAATHFVQFWDGRAIDVEEQALGPILNPVEMAMASEDSAIEIIKSIPGYADLFKAAFPGDADPITYKNIGKAIGDFERGLMTPAPFDDFMKGDITALSPDAMRGLQLFMDAQCTQCHTGPNLGGTMYQKMGSVKEYDTKDLGRYEITKNEDDKKVFKVPGLRNVAKTAPYLHDGSAATLDAVLNVMAEYQTAKGKLSDDERRYLVAFLETLTGTVDEEYIKKPELPENGPKTPAPDPS
ncbi:MAG: cytochrome-c peroxidase [Nannocystaceae bacterium]